MTSKISFKLSFDPLVDFYYLDKPEEINHELYKSKIQSLFESFYYGGRKGQIYPNVNQFYPLFLEAECAMMYKLFNQYFPNLTTFIFIIKDSLSWTDSKWASRVWEIYLETMTKHQRIYFVVIPSVNTSREKLLYRFPGEIRQKIQFLN